MSDDNIRELTPEEIEAENAKVSTPSPAPVKIAPEHYPDFVKIARAKDTTPKKLNDYLKSYGYPVPSFNEAASFLTQARRNPTGTIDPILKYTPQGQTSANQNPLQTIEDHVSPQTQAQPQPDANPNIDPMHPLQSQILNTIADVFSKPEYGLTPEEAHALGSDLNLPAGLNKVVPGAADLGKRAFGGMGLALEGAGHGIDAAVNTTGLNDAISNVLHSKSSVGRELMGLADGFPDLGMVHGLHGVPIPEAPVAEEGLTGVVHDGTPSPYDPATNHNTSVDPIPEADHTGTYHTVNVRDEAGNIVAGGRAYVDPETGKPQGTVLADPFTQETHPVAPEMQAAIEQQLPTTVLPDESVRELTPEQIAEENAKVEEPTVQDQPVQQPEPDLFGETEPVKPLEKPSVSEELPKEPSTPSEKLNNILNGTNKKLEEQAAARTQELSDRIKEGRTRADGKEGEEAFAANLSALKGERVKVKGEDIASQLTQDDIEGLFKQLQNHFSNNFFGGINAFNGLKRMLEGDLPRPSELRLIEEAFGAETTKNIIAHRAEIKKIFNGEGGQAEMFTGEQTLSTGPIKNLGPEEKPVDPNKFIDDPKQGDFFKEKPKFANGGIKPPKPPLGPVANTIANVLNLPRALLSSFDLSAPFRQGIFLVGRKEFYKAMPAMLEQFVKGWGKSDTAFAGLMHDIKTRPTYSLMKESGLHLGEIGDNLTGHEENFMSHWAEKIPGVGRGVMASEKAYVGFLNKLRADVFDDLVSRSKAAGVDFEADPKALKDMASFINNATGRGNLGWFNKSAPLLNGVFFSPRLIASRATLLNPGYYATLSPVVRKEAVKSLLAFSGIAATVMSLAAAGGANVELDPRSSDFLKIKTGNTRYDVTGGFAPYLRLGAILASGQEKTLGGDIKNLGEGYKSDTRLTKEATFLRSKFSPVMSFFVNSQAGTDVVGSKFNPTKDAAALFVPLVIQDAYDLLKDGRSPGQAALMTAPSVVGVGTQTFQPKDQPAKPMAYDPANLFPNTQSVRSMTKKQIEKSQRNNTTVRELTPEQIQEENSKVERPIRELTPEEIQAEDSKVSSKPRELSMSEIVNENAKSIIQSLGYHVTDFGVRSRATQEKYYATTQGVAKPGTSPHEFDRAIDVRPHSGANPLEIKQALQQEGYEGVKIITKRHGTAPHWHVQWERAG